jgi:putative transposase
VGTEVAEVDTAGRDRAKELFGEVEEYHGFEIEEMEVAADHVHVFISFPPKYSISKVVRDTEGSECEGDTEGSFRE